MRHAPSTSTATHLRRSGTRDIGHLQNLHHSDSDPAQGAFADKVRMPSKCALWVLRQFRARSRLDPLPVTAPSRIHPFRLDADGYTDSEASLFCRRVTSTSGRQRLDHADEFVARVALVSGEGDTFRNPPQLIYPGSPALALSSTREWPQPRRSPRLPARRDCWS